ncbi:MAG: hypothetical protein VKO65_04250, partial [Cyanobacteriota bacterium]|nr:hypothetical protein [Cyanobacteriota bacterium]
MNRTLVALEALVLAVLLTPLVLLARMVSGTKPAPFVPLAHPLKNSGCPPEAPAPAVVALQPEPLVIAACTSAPPAAGRTAPPLAAMTVVELRRLAQARGHRSIGGRRTSKARRVDLLE